MNGKNNISNARFFEIKDNTLVVNKTIQGSLEDALMDTRNYKISEVKNILFCKVNMLYPLAVIKVVNLIRHFNEAEGLAFVDVNNFEEKFVSGLLRECKNTKIKEFCFIATDRKSRSNLPDFKKKESSKKKFEISALPGKEKLPSDPDYRGYTIRYIQDKQSVCNKLSSCTIL